MVGSDEKRFFQGCAIRNDGQGQNRQEGRSGHKEKGGVGSNRGKQGMTRGVRRTDRIREEVKTQEKGQGNR